MWKAVADFKDLGGDLHEYKAGDVYPHDGEADAQRVKILSASLPGRSALIMKTDDEAKPKKARQKAEK